MRIVRPTQVLLLFLSSCVTSDGAAPTDGGSSSATVVAESDGGGVDAGADEASVSPPVPTMLLDPNCQAASCCTLASKITGTSGDETLNGTANAECIVGLGGNDTLNAQGQNDEAFGGDGSDSIFGGAGSDTISGGIGADVLRGDAGNDVIYGGRDNDDIQGGADADTIYPGMGADLVNAGDGNDLVVVLDVCELVNGEMLIGGSGTDTLELPMPAADLPQYGVTISGFETVTMVPDRNCEAECRTPCNRVDPAFANWTDPTIWSVDTATGIRFRRTTASERAANTWLRGTYLVEDSTLVAAAAAGGNTLNLRLPLTESTLQTVSLTRNGTTAYVSKISRKVVAGSLQSAVTVPTVHTYVQSGINLTNPQPVNNAWLAGMTTNDGEILVEGSHNARRVRVDGKNPGWTLTTIPVPSGQPPIVVPSVVAVRFEALGPYGIAAHNSCGQAYVDACTWMCANTGVPCGPNNDTIAPQPECSDGIDNDDDGVPGSLQTDSGDTECKHDNKYWSCNAHPNHTHKYESGESFAIMADGRFCTEMRANWFTTLTRIGWDAAQLVKQAAVGPPEGEARYVAGGCWVFSSVAEAHACTTTGACPAWASAYPYKANSVSSSAWYTDSWADVAHGASHGLNQPLHQVVTLYYGFDGTSNNGVLNITNLECLGEEGAGCCGAMQSSSCSTVGASVVAYRSFGDSCSAGLTYSSTAHELGHNVGLEHDNNIFPFSFMKSSGQYPNATLGAANLAQLEVGLESPSCGRRPGFEWNGAPNDPADPCTACP